MLSGILRIFKPDGSREPGPDDAAAQLRALLKEGKLVAADSACRSALKQFPHDVSLWLAAAEIATARNDAGAALASYSKVLELTPDSPLAHYKRANIYKNRGELAQALSDYDRAIALDPGFAHALCNRGVALAALHRPDEALESYGRAIAISADDPVVHFNRGNLLHELGRDSEAESAYARALQLQPQNLQALINRAHVLGALRRFDEARAAYDGALALAPEDAAIRFARGAVLQEQGKLTEALQDYAEALRRDPGHAPAYANRCVVFMKQQRWTEARESIDRALALRPDLPEAHLNLGALYFELKQWPAALQSVERALALRPSFPEALVRRGDILAALLRRDEALACYEAAIAGRGNYAEAHERRAETLVAMRRFGEAITSYDAALAGKPDLPFTRGMRAYARLNVCEWREFAADVARVRAGIEAGDAVCPPLVLLSLVDDEALHLRAAQLWAKHLAPQEAAATPAAVGSGHTPAGKIRLGYFSCDLHEHPVATLMAEVFERHDREQFEVIAFSYGPPSQDPMRKRLERAFDRFIDVSSTADRDVARLAREQGVEVAVDLAGYTGGARSGIFAHRAAPIQVNYLGYAGTLGVDYIDYLIADRTVIPPDRQAHYRERVVYLPYSYLPNDSSRTIATCSRSRAEYGLAETGFVFCSFNNSYKITPKVFALWMRLLQAIPGSILWLSRSDPMTVANLHREATGHGIAAERLVFGERMPSAAEHLARYRAADLFLDTLPYNAHATTVDAVWSGCPVLTRLGNAFAGRAAASVLLSLGMPELVTRSAEEYERTAIQLATESQTLAAIKARLALKVASSPLFDTPLLTRHLETAFQVMAQRQRSGLPAAHFSVDP